MSENVNKTNLNKSNLTEDDEDETKSAKVRRTTTATLVFSYLTRHRATTSNALWARDEESREFSRGDRWESP